MIYKNWFTFSFLLIICLSCEDKKIIAPEDSASLEEVDYVNPLIGTAFAGFQEGREGGGTMPCVNVPFAMTNFVAQTRQNKMGMMPYVYEDSTVIGFLATHQPTVWMGDYGYVSLMPQLGDLKTRPQERALSFQHNKEVAKPETYSVKMETATGEEIKGEIAGVSAAAMFRFTFPEEKAPRIIIQGINLNDSLQDWVNDIESRMDKMKGYIEINPDNKEVVGYNPDHQSAQLGPELKDFKGYFVIQFDSEITSYGTWDRDKIFQDERTQYGTQSGAYINFQEKEGNVVRAKIGTSFISVAQARENLNNEIPDWNFEEIVEYTRNSWQNELSKMKVKGISDDKKSIFYTALFHSLLFPREFSEDGRYYSVFDHKIHEGISYNDYSLWDTFRALHPLYTIIQQDRVDPMVQGLLQMYEQGGWLPKWPNPTYTNIMIGSPADAVIADAFMKGHRDYDTSLAYEAIKKNAYVAPEGDRQKDWGDRDRWTSYEARGGLSYYHDLGYVPADKVKESVSRTIEFSYADFCVAQLAKELDDSAVYEVLSRRSQNYKNLFREETGFMAPKEIDGSWHPDPEKGFTEGTKWTYTFGALHDVPGMISLMGGQEKFAAKLTENFEEGHYRPDNEPGHHYIYLFNFAEEPWKTQELVRKHTSEENYRNAPVGINGNDDCGQTSAWYIFSVLGFYPVTPGTPEYIIGAPQYPEITIQLPENKSFTVKALNLSEENKYIKQVTLNGKRWNSFKLPHSAIVNGGDLIFEMTDEPISFIEKN